VPPVARATLHAETAVESAAEVAAALVLPQGPHDGLTAAVFSLAHYGMREPLSLLHGAGV